MNIRILPVAAAVVLSLATVSIVRTQPTRQSEPPPIAPPRSEFDHRVAAVGLVEPSSESISLSSHLPGVVDRVFVTVGQDVKKGAALVKLDTRALEAALNERRTELAAHHANVKVSVARAGTARAALADMRRRLEFAESVFKGRAISTSEVTERRSAVETAEAEVSAADAAIAAADAAVHSSEAAIQSIETDLARSTVTAPVDGRILQLRIRPGEFAPAGQAQQPWLILGQIQPLHVRVDVDEYEAWRVVPGAPAIGQVRGNADLRTPLQFVRFEPFVVPKQSLTGSSTERVDTRVMQAIYRVERADLPIFVGQQMDVFIEAGRTKPLSSVTHDQTSHSAHAKSGSGAES